MLRELNVHTDQNSETKIAFLDNKLQNISYMMESGFENRKKFV